MRQLSAARILGKRPACQTDGGRPKPGTKVREIYDLFYPPLTVVPSSAIYDILLRGHPGKTRSQMCGIWSGVRDMLVDQYGLDLRKRSYREWWLVGEYNEKGEYISYFEEQAKKEGIIK